MLLPAAKTVPGTNCQFTYFSGADYYRESLRFLGTVDVSTLTVQESVERAYDMGLSALVGKGIYNMGELLSHSILDSLRGTEKEWLVNLLTAFNSGT